MKLLFITANTGGTGEAITALHMAEALEAAGHRIGFLASDFTAPFLAERFGHAVFPLALDAGDDRCWQEAPDRFAADLVVFADYPLLYSTPEGIAVARSGWIESVRDRGARLATLDHLGMAQQPGVLYFGPPHIGISVQRMPELPAGMEILLPCPVHDPAPIEGRRGLPFRYWELPLGIGDDARARVRRRYLESDDEFLVFHSVPGWARRYAEIHRLPHYRGFARILEAWLSRAPRPVTVVSVNGGGLLGRATSSGVRFVETGPLSRDRYQEILLAADLMLTDNRISVSLGKAVCGDVPAVALRNSYRLVELVDHAAPPVRELLLEMEAERPGAVFPFEVFPIWGRRELQTLGIAGHDCAAAAAEVELYGGEESAGRIVELLADGPARAERIARQRCYCERLISLPDPVGAVARLVAAGPS